jgi:hypothetical protein
MKRWSGGITCIPRGRRNYLQNGEQVLDNLKRGKNKPK